MSLQDIIAQVKPYTLTSDERLAAMALAVERIDRDGIAGDIVECGVWRGGNIILARKLSPNRVCWLFDTFAGMTTPQDVDRNRAGNPAPADRRNAASLDEVKNGLNETGVYDESKLRFVVGDVCETLHEPANRPQRIALLRLDTDWHASTSAELEILYPLLAPGGVLIVDDYGHWRGARKAVDDYFGEYLNAEQIDYTAIKIVKDGRETGDQ